MALSHAVVSLDHHKATIQQFSADEVHATHVKDHQHDTRQHNSEVRAVHEYFGAVCDALAGVAEVLVAGSSTVQSDFRHYVEKHRPALAKQIAGYETVNNPTDAELVALARKFFLAHDRMVGTAPLA